MLRYVCASGVVASFFGLAFFTACGSDEADGSSSAGQPTSSGTSSTGPGGECTGASDCPGHDGVCDPATHTCTTGLPCTMHSECGALAYCSGGACTDSGGGGPCDVDENCLSGESCTGGVCGCGGSLYGADAVPPNVLVVLDRSSSMNEDIGGGTKWNIARQAISTMLASYGSGVYFGLMLYPGTDLSGMQGMQCGPGAVFVDPAPGTQADIDMTLNGAGTTSFATPTAEALDTLVDYPSLEDTERANYVMLVTDGQSTCADPVASVTALRNEMPEIKTFVVGFGSGVDPTELDAMAQAGGTAKMQPPSYYQADDAASLADAFASIAGTVLSCSYLLSETPPDPNQLYVYVDGQPVQQDATNGWSYDPATNQIVFNGTSCESLTSGMAKEVVVSYGCPLVAPK